MTGHPNIAVIGLGYVGLPLAVALAEHFPVIGFDVDSDRIDQLQLDHDRTREVGPERLAGSTLRLTANAVDCGGMDLLIVTVPTPVDGDNRPDLSHVMAATRTVASLIDPALRPTVVYESTVYPGVTEEECGAELERISGLKRGRDFRLGYSPERINPGDREHSIDRITKVIAAEDDETLELLAKVYGAINGGNVFRAASIRVAEAAKVIENAQRDINIAFMNEVAQIMARIDVSVWDVLAAARTKWNFLGFEPGLVGGHCIGVDPYYLSHLSQALGHNPEVILAGRTINDAMGAWVADRLHERRSGKPGRVLVLGLTFKENVPDLRNSRVFDVIGRLTELGHRVSVTDPLADPDEVERDFGLTLRTPDGESFDLVIGAVAHDEFRALSADALGNLVAPGGTFADLKGMWRDLHLDPSIDRWTL
jgi:UDP-N-acetyl-D-glucosamine/UDP-N-acetyl-D-galactosamine dehydrogenase